MGTRILCLNKPSRWFWYMFKFENHTTPSKRLEYSSLGKLNRKDLRKESFQWNSPARSSESEIHSWQMPPMCPEILKHFTASFLNGNNQYPQDMPLTGRGRIQTNRGKSDLEDIMQGSKNFKKILDVFREIWEDICHYKVQINEIKHVSRLFLK